ncbi:type II toxin-antitoxin system RelE/ParE family toxin [Caballeronia sp. BR00000012568055]|uniref:type II toxin-antitoxin system RelE/ParE family toxin n=1 Tax=Caballeronia sp. BR00000012568055 TaxID=2918761 RepID=UPI0023F95614|nr:type II toxin-antitoxin system RelE/ParE family toxin [Caballeronia sp. BR00000012568055]
MRFEESEIRPLYWLASSKRDLKAMPADVQDTFGFALHQAQAGGKHEKAKALRGFGSAGVLEVVESTQGSAFRAIYTVKFESAVYVLHCFQKKSTRGIATSKPDIDIILERLKAAQAHAAKETS